VEKKRILDLCKTKWALKERGEACILKSGPHVRGSHIQTRNQGKEKEVARTGTKKAGKGKKIGQRGYICTCQGGRHNSVEKIAVKTWGKERLLRIGDLGGLSAKERDIRQIGKEHEKGGKLRMICGLPDAQSEKDGTKLNEEGR